MLIFGLVFMITVYPTFFDTAFMRSHVRFCRYAENNQLKKKGIVTVFYTVTINLIIISFQRVRILLKLFSFLLLWKN